MIDSRQWPVMAHVMFLILCQTQTSALVLQQSPGSSEVNDVSNTQILQVLGHLTPLRELGVHITEVNLGTEWRQDQNGRI